MPESIRLYAKGAVVGFKAAKRNQNSNLSLIKIEGVNDTPSVDYYLGKRVAYVYKAEKSKKTATGKKTTKERVIWGRVVKPHGNSGVAKARFRNNLPPKALGGRVRVMMYPSRQ